MSKMSVEFLRKNEPGLYHYLLRFKPEWIDRYYTRLRKPNNFWTLDNLIKDAKKYKSRREWKMNSPGAYSRALKDKLMNKCCNHMSASKTARKWNLETCKVDALKYKTRKEWNIKSSGAYGKAFDNGWIELCCSHMKLDLHVGRNKRTINLDTGEIFESATLAEESNNLNKGRIIAAIGRKHKCGGYYWAYCNEKGNIIK
jgi:hypothetical protein